MPRGTKIRCRKNWSRFIPLTSSTTRPSTANPTPDVYSHCVPGWKFSGRAPHAPGVLRERNWLRQVRAPEELARGALGAHGEAGRVREDVLKGHLPVGRDQPDAGAPRVVGEVPDRHTRILELRYELRDGI